MSKRTLLYLVLAILVGVPVLGYLRQGRMGYNTSTISYGMGGGVTGEMPSMPNAVEPMMAEVDRGGVYMDSAQSAKMIAPMPPIEDESGFTPGVERTIVKTANLGFVVNNTRQTVDQVSQVISAQGGTVTQSDVYEAPYAGGGVTANMTLRVPVAQLEATVSQLKELAQKVVSESISASDQTEQKVDMEAQLRNLRATETQLLNIMEQANKVEDVLSVQRELNTVRSQIERLDARLTNLSGAAEMSTIYLNISTQESELPVVDPSQPSLWQELKISIREAVLFYRGLFVSGLRLAVVGLPAILVVAVIWMVFRTKSK